MLAGKRAPDALSERGDFHPLIKITFIIRQFFFLKSSDSREHQ
jgi:hypothetical protein